jgi:protease II
LADAVGWRKVRRKDIRQDGSAPLYQYAYGAYGASSDPVFDPAVISLLDRGFVHAIAHVRGGRELGRAWYAAAAVPDRDGRRAPRQAGALRGAR